MKRFWKTLSMSVVAAALLVACKSTTSSGAVGAGGKQFMLLSEEQVTQASAVEYQKMLQEGRNKGVLNRDFALQARIQKITNRIIPHVGVYRTDALKWKWELNVFQSDEVNAFCMAGGKMGVYSGLVNKLKLTDAEIAAVMGHEVAHALREHVREQMSIEQAQQLPLVIASLITGNSAWAELGGMVGQATISLPRSRKHEVEADRMGLELAARAGYDPSAAITLWQKMNQLGGARPPEFLSTHPSPESRQADLRRVAQIVQPLYLAAPKP